MSGFTLDTSGAVPLAHYCAASDQTFVSTMWSDLDPFTQGYVEALFFTSRDEWIAATGAGRQGCERYAAEAGFSDLAPKTLAAILTDCGEQTYYPARTKVNGAAFWKYRQLDAFHGFPPLTPSLGDDGKVYLRPA